MSEQVALESHLRWCVTCRARVEDMQLIGASLRVAAPAQETTLDEIPELAAIQSEVLTRVRAEHDLSLPVRMRELFADMRFLWPAMGASAALAACLFAAVAVHSAARGAETDSIANMIAELANESAERIAPLAPLSAYFPVQFDGRMLAPRSLDDGAALEAIPEGDAAFTLEAVVTREGRVVNSELVQSERAGILRRASAHDADDVVALLGAVQRARFAPAQAADGGALAVRVVWLVTRTTVKGSPRGARIDEDETIRPPLSDALEQPEPRPARS